MRSPSVSYVQCDDATVESEAAALGAVFRFVLESHAKKNAAGMTSTNGDDAKGSRNDRAIRKYTR